MIELVWDAGRTGTALAPSGELLEVGDGAPLSPEDLVGVAVASCLMRTTLRLAERAGVSLLSFAATAAITATPEPRTVVHAHIVASPESDLESVHQVCHDAVEASPMALLLGARLSVTWNVRTLCRSVPSEGTVH
jgi:organic hydroperoxide reductase OsmC/OhrA